MPVTGRSDLAFSAAAHECSSHPNTATTAHADAHPMLCFVLTNASVAALSPAHLVPNHAGSPFPASTLPRSDHFTVHVANSFAYTILPVSAFNPCPKLPVTIVAVTFTRCCPVDST
ncbi:hypothetical protein DFP72DRAFT_1084603 [Ephemerocybe angulata]|uniref:Uncharacterized protein n=1 Tax=Ephemerocybe angulata TaxID=980116 RepID=A0A8H6LRP0_9AGAR|nr:hypothetical protein DFP72DRAFT_1084603 [Tulosesus angulatus]